jgi:hypothetical protein
MKHKSIANSARTDSENIKATPCQCAAIIANENPLTISNYIALHRELISPLPNIIVTVDVGDRYLLSCFCLMMLPYGQWPPIVAEVSRHSSLVTRQNKEKREANVGMYLRLR